MGILGFGFWILDYNSLPKAGWRNRLGMRLPSIFCEVIGVALYTGDRFVVSS